MSDSAIGEATLRWLWKQKVWDTYKFYKCRCQRFGNITIAMPNLMLDSSYAEEKQTKCLPTNVGLIEEAINNLSRKKTTKLSLSDFLIKLVT